MKKRDSDEQIIGFLKQASEGTPIKELCRKHGFSDASFYLWRHRFGGMDDPMQNAFANWKLKMRSCWPKRCWTSTAASAARPQPHRVDGLCLRCAR